jgi:carbon-monoxide dehydrogenase iron sulfur subunit
MEMKDPTLSLTVDSQSCTGCGDCSRACLDQLRERPSPVRNGHSRIRVFGEGPLFWISVCRECAEAPCADACISGALQLGHAGGYVELDQEVCIGCGMCVMVCPFGAIWLDTGRSRSFKCDLCPTHSNLPCVTACQPGALRLEGAGALAADRRRHATNSVLSPDRKPIADRSGALQ